MIFKKLKNNPSFKIITNKYIIILVVFVVWMLFFDENSYLTHKEFNENINQLNTSIEFYKNKVYQDRATIKKLQDSIELKRYAREKYFMKKENEDIYIIEFDTIKK